MTVSAKCAEIGEKLLNAREVLQAALEMVAHAKHPEDIVSQGLAKDMINQAKELERDVELPGKEGMRLEVSLASALDSINKRDYDTAISKILNARRELLDLMFQSVVACECGEAKAIEKHLGEGALKKIFATQYYTITDPGKTVFYIGDVVTEEAFNRENDRVRRLGERPATGRPGK